MGWDDMPYHRGGCLIGSKASGHEVGPQRAEAVARGAGEALGVDGEDELLAAEGGQGREKGRGRERRAATDHEGVAWSATFTTSW